MAKNDNSIILAVIILAGFIYFVYPPSIFAPGAVGGNNQQPQQQAPVQSGVDLRGVAAPWVAATNITELCVYYLGTWHNTANWVGCEGVGALNCDTPAVLAAQTQCEGAGGNWVCSPTDIYCRIG